MIVVNVVVVVVAGGVIELECYRQVPPKPRLSHIYVLLFVSVGLALDIMTFFLLMVNVVLMFLMVCWWWWH